MSVQTYDDFKRMLDACAVAAHPHPWRHEEVLAVLDGHNRIADADAVGRIVRVARALGIDVRRRLEWKPTLPGGWREARVDGERMSLAGDNGDETWSACVFQFDHSANLLRVEGHPTRESAIEHLERLLGREDVTP